MLAAVLIATFSVSAAPAGATDADPDVTGQTVDPVANAIDAYVDAAGGGTEGSSGSWLFVVAFLLALAGTFFIAVRLRRTRSTEG